MKEKPKAACKKCGFVWTPRVENPRACPRCKSYDFKKERVQK
jgi:predicted Zn-ribbon and HTH transcriptional regulator